MRRIITSLFACACLLCANAFASVAEEHPAPKNLKLDYFDDGKGSNETVILSWDAPDLPAGVTVSGYKVTYQPAGQELKEMSSTYNYRCAAATSYFYGKSTCEFGVYALCSDGEKTPVAKVSFDASDKNVMQRGHVFPTFSKFKTYGPDADGNADELRNGYLIMGVYPGYCYVQEDGGASLKVLDNDAAQKFKAGNKIENLKAVFVKAEDRTYTLTYESSALLSEGNEVTASNGSLSTVQSFGLASEFAKMYMFNGVTVNVSGSTATITQGSVTLPLVDPTGKIFEQGTVIPTPATVIGFVDKNSEGGMVIVCKEIKEGPKSSFETLQALQSADLIDGMEYTVTGNILVGGSVSSYGSSIYFLQDETAGIALSTGYSELGMFADVKAPEAGDMIKNLKVLYADGGMTYVSHEGVSTGNDVPVRKAAIADFYEKDFAGYVVSIENANLMEMGGSVALAQGEEDILPVMPTEDTMAALQSMLGKTVNGVFFVNFMQGSPCLYLRSAEDLKEVAAYPAVNNFIVNSYERSGSGSAFAWKIELIWDTPIVPEGAKIKDYTVKYVTVGTDGTVSEEKNFTYNGTAYSTAISSTGSYCKDLAKYKFRIYVNYTVGTETKTSEMVETPVVDLTDESRVLYPSYFTNIAAVKNGANSQPALVNREVSIRSEVLVTGVTSSVIYLGDKSNGNPIKLLAAEGASLPNLTTGTLIKDLKFVLRKAAMDKSYTAEYVSSATVSTGNEVTPYSNFYASNVLGSEIGRLAELKSVILTVDKKAKTATVAQEAEDDTYTIGLIDPSERIYADDYVVPIPVDIVFFVELNGDQPVLQLRDIEDIKQGAPVSFATIGAMKTAGGSSLIYTLTSDVLVTGKSLSPYGNTMYFGQDETGAIIFQYNGGGGGPLALDNGNGDPAVGDILNNMRGNYDADYGFACTKMEVKSKNNPMPVAENKTIPAIIKDDLGKYVKVTGTLKLIFQEYGGEFYFISAALEDGENSIVVSIPVTVDIKGNMIPDAEVVKLDGHEIEGYFNVSMDMQTGSVALALASAKNIQPVSISNVKASQISIENGWITVDGASVEVYDAAGRKITASEEGKASVAGINGMILVKAIYANGEVKVIKAMVK